MGLILADAAWVPLAALCLALLLDALIGDPDWLWRRVPHPVVAIGRAIGFVDDRLNRGSGRRRRVAGVGAVAVLVSGAIGLGWGLAALTGRIPFGWAVEAAIAATLLAGRSLVCHVGAVADGLDRAGLDGGRRAVARIVGRDPDSLDEAGVARAAIESLAENFSDGLAAPVFWYALAGLPGLLAYKAINTADSMIGHRSERHRAFGWAAARLDDLVNLIPARLTAPLFALAAVVLPGASPRAALAAAWADAPHHRSPNAGWPEAAMAGALGLALAGPRAYGGDVVADAWMNRDGRQAAMASDIRRALRLAAGAWVLIGLAALAALAATL